MKQLCKVEGCCNAAMGGRYVHGLCSKHYRNKGFERCRVEGCENSLYSKGYCQKHYVQEMRGKSSTKCCVDGCTNISYYADGYCFKHAAQIRDEGKVFKTKNEAYRESRSALISAVLLDLKNGMQREDVRIKYSLTRDNLKYIIYQYGDESMKIDQSLTAEQIIQKLINNGTALQYAGEYKRGQYVLLHCDVCGSTMRYSAGSLFKHVNCKHCKEIAKQEKKQELEAQRESERKSREDAAEERKRICEQERSERMREVSCTVCGKMFTTTNPRRFTCSSECSRKRANALHSRKHDKRIQKQKRYDKIELSVLFRRDGGVCHICGRQCDMNDYTQTDTAFIAGNLYPSIDHLIPVSKGGADSWANVMLAHRICNSVRGNKI